jgi:hypothetical protein
MDDHSFDALTRQSVGSTSRRGSVLTLAAAGIVAGLAAPFMASAKDATTEKKRGKKKHENSTPIQTQPAPQECPPVPPDLCIGQSQPCVDRFTRCASSPACQIAIPVVHTLKRVTSADFSAAW